MSRIRIFRAGLPVAAGDIHSVISLHIETLRKQEDQAIILHPNFADVMVMERYGLTVLGAISPILQVRHLPPAFFSFYQLFFSFARSFSKIRLAILPSDCYNLVLCEKYRQKGSLI